MAGKKGRKNKSLVWNFFKKLDKEKALCNFCKGTYSHKTNISYMLNHLKKNHKEAVSKFKKRGRPPRKRKRSSSSSSSNETSNSSLPAVEVLSETDHDEGGENSMAEEEPSDIWRLFTRIDNIFAECNLCQVKLSCRHSITDLIAHRELEHSDVLLKCDSSEDELISYVEESCHDAAEDNLSLTVQSPKSSSQTDGTFEIERAMRLRRSPNWQYFTMIDKINAKCKICGNLISYLSISNLKRHIIKAHSQELLARADSGKEQSAKKNVDDLSTNDLALTQQNQSEVSDIEDDMSVNDLAWTPQNQSDVSDSEDVSEEESSEEVSKDTSDAQSFDHASGYNCSKRMKLDHLDHEDQVIKTGTDDVSMDKTQHSSKDVTAPSGGRKTSFVWTHFSQLDNGCYRCKICGRMMSKKSMAGCLLKHIKRVHPSLRDKAYPQVQSRIAESEVSSLNQLPESLRKELVIKSSISFDSEQEAEHILTQTAGSSEVQDERISEPRTLYSSGERDKRICKPRSVCSVSDANDLLLSKRLVDAVEEKNQLLRNLQKAVQRQGEALNRLVTCLQGMNPLPKNAVNKGMN